MSNFKKGINFRNIGRILTEDVVSAATKKVVRPLERAFAQGIARPVKQKIIKPIVDNVIRPIKRVTKPAELKRIGRKITNAAGETVDTLHALQIMRTIPDAIPRGVIGESRDFVNTLGRKKIIPPTTTVKLRSALELAGRKRGIVFDSPNSKTFRAIYDSDERISDLRDIAHVKRVLIQNDAAKTLRQQRTDKAVKRIKNLLRIPENAENKKPDFNTFRGRMGVYIQPETPTTRSARKARMPTNDSDIRARAEILLDKNNPYREYVENAIGLVNLGINAALPTAAIGGAYAGVKAYAGEKLHEIMSDAQSYAGDKVKRTKNYISPSAPVFRQAPQYTSLPKSDMRARTRRYAPREIIGSDEDLARWSLPATRIKTTAPKPVTKMMGGKSGRMGKELEGADGVKGRYFEKGAVQGRTAKFYETDKPHTPQMRTLTKSQILKLQTQKFYEINNANYYGEQKMQKPNTFRKNTSIGNSVNIGGGMNGYLGSSGMGRKPMMSIAQPRQKLPSPMNGPAQRSTTFKPMGGSLNTFNPYPRSGSMATGMGAPTMKRMTTPRKRGFN